jgi:hypothetical protein
LRNLKVACDELGSSTLPFGINGTLTTTQDLLVHLPGCATANFRFGIFGIKGERDSGSRGTPRYSSTAEVGKAKRLLNRARVLASERHVLYERRFLDSFARESDLQLEAFARIRGPKELVIIPGDHYTSYLEFLTEAAGAAADYFSCQLNRKIWDNAHKRALGLM